jgi:hypothetical protein
MDYRLGFFDVGSCLFKLACTAGYLGKGVLRPKDLLVPVKRGRDFDGFFKMADGLLCFPLVSIGESENTVKIAKKVLLA